MNLDSQEILALIGTSIALLFSAIYAYSNSRNLKKFSSSIKIILIGYGIFQVLLVSYLWFNHLNFPLNLESMELTMLQHVRRVMHGLPIYVDPSSDFVALIYNPLYYYLNIPFALIFGDKLSTMRFVSITGTIGSGLMILLIVRRHTGSLTWGIIALGLFCASYRAMDFIP